MNIDEIKSKACGRKLHHFDQWKVSFTTIIVKDVVHEAQSYRFSGGHVIDPFSGVNVPGEIHVIYVPDDQIECLITHGTAIDKFSDGTYEGNIKEIWKFLN